MAVSQDYSQGQMYDQGKQDLPYSRKLGGKFQNTKDTQIRSLAKLPVIAKEWLTAKHKLSEPKAGVIPVLPINRGRLQHGEGLSFYRLGHSSILLSMVGQWWLIDPVFSKRASPVQWAGPKRFHPSPIKIKDLPPITGVIISHDHYDHLDKQTIKQLKSKVKNFIVPLGVDAHLRAWGVDAKKIHALDWWQTMHIAGVDLTATPAQHFSGRGISDGDETLWASWAIKSKTESVFYSGDGGYFDGFKVIGEQLGPFDLTFIETGAYNKTWENVHMLPEQSVQAHLDVQGQYMVPVHNSTFDLSLHAWYEPLERVSAAAQSNKVQLLTPMLGQRLNLEQSENDAWWRSLMPGSSS
jgi:L-ascorbate metabolism protein UlaG (beta-lactamase superfamily)